MKGPVYSWCLFLGRVLKGGVGGGCRVKEEVEGSAGTKGRTGQVLRVSVGAGHDRSSSEWITATRREPTEAPERIKEPSRDTGWGRAGSVGTATLRKCSAQ